MLFRRSSSNGTDWSSSTSFTICQESPGLGTPPDWSQGICKGCPTVPLYSVGSVVGEKVPITDKKRYVHYRINPFSWHSFTKIRTCINDNISGFMKRVITQPCPYICSDLSKRPLKLGHTGNVINGMSSKCKSCEHSVSSHICSNVILVASGHGHSRTEVTCAKFWLDFVIICYVIARVNYIEETRFPTTDCPEGNLKINISFDIFSFSLAFWLGQLRHKLR